MFTGIIEHVGIVKSIDKHGVSGKIKVQASSVFLDTHSVKIGDSIAIDGVCLTVTSLSGDEFTADVSEETFSLTTLGKLTDGSRVNLEAALTLSTPVGGHLVTGHIDGVGTIIKKGLMGSNVEIELKVPDELRAGLVFKGSIAVDGISLTIASVTKDGVRIALIPHTLANTALEDKAVGSEVNIETDIIGKYVESQLHGKKKVDRVTESFLAEHGFLPKKG